MNRLLQTARSQAAKANFSELLRLCQQLRCDPAVTPDQLLDVANLLNQFGFLSEAEDSCRQALALAPKDLRPWVTLANVERERDNHAASRTHYARLQSQLPDHPIIRRNLLVGQEYDPAISDTERFNAARAWGDWAIDRAGGARARPPLKPLKNRPLRLGYVSADLCQHTVGLFLNPVLGAHDLQRITAFAYNASAQTDWVTRAITASCRATGGAVRDITRLDDAALAQCIQTDQIDVLIDLSGHTAGSRLSVFAHRPAPVQVSWLGYFATTGLTTLEAVLLDPWHAPEGTEAQFVEPILRLPAGRWCYQPVPWAPKELSPPPAERNGWITFGSFNNTAKLNDGVYDLWAQILTAVPDSRLLLKWRTFNDAALRQRVTQAFMTRGIAAERIELRGPSFHADLLTEYAELDIALDPFPFTGGLTSCEALWMGVPVITWPQGRVVSRQGFALLSAIGLAELAAAGAQDYVRLAVALANDPDRLRALRTGLRKRMRCAPLMDVVGFTRSLEEKLIQLYRRIEREVIRSA
ncbi:MULTISPECIES: O-linked N-acetylglucosamine transferase, SPINDLY family protein [Thiorhodovibrio]|uniref:O-linked N-acetylglucosamine transferase, SPINDLY family protein n=1 Tax=Thiorhodovibrio TaxID=61593 RepID=UPI001911E2EE|nr:MULTISPECIES: hypothetical protein [Thiorhodovibrio]MBK5968307.1 hypothetical protein [Thiorhodovibrio winogradskyi]WPL15020.1 putative O-linked N-acetylglucosamine transferase, SPINDLY family [Thiorhodovibrio litoralis]